MALLAHPVGAFLDLGEGDVDLLDRGGGLGAEGEVALALHGERVAFAGLLVELHVARLALGDEQIGLGAAATRPGGCR